MSFFKAELHSWSLTFYGTSTDPEPKAAPTPPPVVVQQQPKVAPSIAPSIAPSQAPPQAAPMTPKSRPAVSYDNTASAAAARPQPPVQSSGSPSVAASMQEAAPLYPSMEPYKSAMPALSTLTTIANCQEQVGFYVLLNHFH